MAGRFSVEAVFKAIDGITGPVDRMASSVSKFTKRAEKNFKSMNDAVNKFGAGLKKYGMIGVGALTAIAYAAYDALKASAEFEEAITQASVKFTDLKKGSEAYKALEQAARKAAISSEYSAVQTAGGLKALGAAGLDVQRSIAALPAVMNLAKLSGMSLEDTAKLNTQSLEAFGLASKDATQYAANMTRMNDTMARVYSTSGASIETMNEAIGEGGSVFLQTGGSIETFLAIVGRMNKAGIDGATMGGILRRATVKLAAPTKAAAQLMNNLGIKTKDSKKNFRDIVDILADVEAGTKNMGSQQRLAALSTLYGAKSVGDISTLLKIGSTELKKYRDETKKTGVTAEKVAAVLDDTLNDRVEQLGNVFDDLKISIGKTRTEGVTKMVDDLTKMSTKMSEIIEKNPKLADGMIKDIGGAVTSLAIIFGSLTAVWATLKIGLWIKWIAINLWKVIAFLGGKIGWLIKIIGYSFFYIGKAFAFLRPIITAIVMGIGGLSFVIMIAVAAWGVAIYEMISRWDEFSTSVEEFWKMFKAWGSSAIDWVLEALKTIAYPFVTLYNAISGLLGKGSQIKDLFNKPIVYPAPLPGLGGRPEPESATPGWITGDTASPQVVSPAARMADTISEKRTMNSFELKIKDESPKKERSSLTGNGRPIRRASSGAFAPVHG